VEHEAALFAYDAVNRALGFLFELPSSPDLGSVTERLEKTRELLRLQVREVKTDD
jgi:hypothetical protein